MANTNIALGVQPVNLGSGLDRYLKFAQIKQANDNNQMADLEREDYMKSRQNKDRYIQAAQQYGAESPQAMQALSAIDPAAAGKYQSDLAANKSTVDRNQADLVQKKIDAAAQIGGALMNEKGTAITQQDWDKFRSDLGSIDENLLKMVPARPNVQWLGSKLAEYQKAQEADKQQSSSSPYWTSVSTPQGVMAFDNRSGKMYPIDVNGNPVMKATDDPTQQGLIAGAREQATSDVQLEMEPAIAAAVEQSKVIGKDTGEKLVELNQRIAQMPELERVVGELDELGKEATYSLAGQGVDIARRQLGFDPRDSSKARVEYIAKIDNDILPLLRATFGAQFTQKEGDSLKATLGNPNLHPDEKTMILKAFISTKMSQIAQLQNNPQLNGGGGSLPTAPSAPAGGAPPTVVDWNELP